MANIPTHMRVQDDPFALTVRRRRSAQLSTPVLVGMGVSIGLAMAALTLMAGLIH